MDISYHYPPELLQLLIDTIPLLCRSKKDVLLFIRGAGVSKAITADLEQRVLENKEQITKFEIVRVALSRLNERGEASLRERREVLRRVVEFEDFSTCWPDDQLKAKGLAAEIRRVVEVKDSFTRMRQDRDRERQKNQTEYEAKVAVARERTSALQGVRDRLYALFTNSDGSKRGTQFEVIVNDLFKAYGILVKEAFRIVGEKGEGVIEQIDGVIVLDGELHFD